MCHIEIKNIIKENNENRFIQPERVAWNLCNIFHKWKRGNDEECKLFHTFIPCKEFRYIFPKETSKSNGVSLI